MHKNGMMKIHQIKIPFNFIKYNIKTNATVLCMELWLCMLCVSKLAELNIKLGQLKFLAYVNYALIKKCQEQCTSLIGSVFFFS